MALQKNVVSGRTGMTLGYHTIEQVSFGNGKATIMVASYLDKAAKDAGKQFADLTPVQVDYAGANLGKPVYDWAQDQVVATEQFQGASVVA
jgi:ribosomal protein L30E